MNYTLEELATLPVSAKFTTLDDVTISIIDLNTGLVVPITSAVCTELLATAPGFFSWNFSNLTTQPTTSSLKRFLWIMSNGTTQYSEVVTVAGWTEKIGVNIVELPAIAIDKGDIIIGDTWSPRFEVKTTDSDLKVKIDITDGGGNVLQKATANDGGADDQIELLCSGDIFQVLRLYVTAAESSVFTGKRIHLNTTITLSDLTVLTIATVIPISSTAAITW